MTSERSDHSVIEADVVLLTCIEELYGELHHIGTYTCHYILDTTGVLFTTYL